MRYEVYTINGLHAVARSQSKAIRLASDVPANCNGNAGILVKDRRHSYPSAGIQVLNGMPVRHTMLLYPPDSKCRQYIPEEWLAECLATR
jgi:hypothetical protein